MDIAAAWGGKVLAIRPDSLGAMLAVSPDASRFAGSYQPGNSFRTTPGGTAVLTVEGPLFNRGALLNENLGLATYEGLAVKLGQAARDPQVKAILLDLDSPGGEAVGAFELAATIRKIGAEKPTYAVVNGIACSAAYGLASACRAVITSADGLSGSIGVVAMHVDQSRALEKAGITPTLIYAGKHKTAGNPYEPLSKAVKGDLQQDINRYYALFLDSVAAGRGARLTRDAARKTEARTYIGRDAVTAGLADDVGTFDETLAEVERLTRTTSPTRTGGTAMVDLSTYHANANPPLAAASQPRAGGAADWETIAAELNGAAAQPAATATTDNEVGKSHFGLPKQQGTGDWDEIAAILNREAAGPSSQAKR